MAHLDTAVTDRVRALPRRPTYLERLEAESIHIIREVVAESRRPVMLYSIGKDSSVMLHLARKAFFPAPLPFPLLHIDTTWKFRDMIQFRDELARREDLALIVHVNREGAARGINPFDHGSALGNRSSRSTSYACRSGWPFGSRTSVLSHGPRVEP